nr:hypothetical protein [Ktedonobacterales bacterium]
MPQKRTASPRPRGSAGAGAAPTPPSTDPAASAPDGALAAPDARRQVFQPVPAPTKVDYPLLEAGIQRWWDEHDVLYAYLHRNDGSERRWSFMDGPITANNPMGVHHAWGRTYKDLY